MNKIAVWTDGKERVRRKHYSPEDVNTNGAVSVTSEEPSPPATEDYEEVTEFFNEEQGFYYEVSGEDPYKNLKETEKAILRMVEEINYDNYEALEDEIMKGGGN